MYALEVNELTPTSQWLSTAVFYFPLTQRLQRVYQHFWTILFQGVVWEPASFQLVASLSPAGASTQL